MLPNEASPGETPIAPARFSKEFRTLWFRATRNLVVGSLISVLPAFIFYSVAFSYTPRQLRLLLGVVPCAVTAALALDMGLNWLYLRPFHRFRPGETESREVTRVYARLHNFPLFSFARVFGPHALAGTGISQLAVIYGNAHWNLGIPSRDFAVYWLLNLTLVPIGHAIFEYHANGWAVRGPLCALVAESPTVEVTSQVWHVGLAIRLAVFYTLLALSPLVLLAAAVRLRSFNPASGPVAWSEVGVVIAGVTALNLLLLLLFAFDLNRQTQMLLRSLQRVEEGDLAVQAILFSPDEFGLVSGGVNKMIRGLRDRQRIRDLFGVYLSPEVSRAILEGRVTLEGQALEVSVLFCDIRDFTRFSASRSPREVVGRLNQFFSCMTEAVTEQGGTINKFLGDGFLAVFGVPVAQPDHARRAVDAALEMEARLRRLNDELAERGEPPIEIGIGIDSGEVIAGNLGAQNRLEYTVIGDPVNRSSRIEQLNKGLGTRILISSRTRDRGEVKLGREFPPVTVKGIAEPLTVFAVGTKG